MALDLPVTTIAGSHANHHRRATAKDLADLDVVAREADIVGYSFLQSAADIAHLQEELTRRAPDRIAAIAAKIETPPAVQRLPEIIVQGAGAQPFAVRIARGDLAVEIGFGRLAEIQEEILDDLSRAG